MGSTKKLSDKQIEGMKMLRANGCSYRQIADYMKVGYGSVQKYTRTTAFLPKSQRKNPFLLVSPEIAPKMYDSRIPNPDDYEDMKNREWYLERHTAGEPFKGPLNMFSLTELQELMEEPTNYHSDLSMAEWAQHYLEGPNNFLKNSPHVWGIGQLEIFNMWEKHRKIMLEYHRGFGKTMAADAILVREICEHRENNYAICSETTRKARARVKHIGDVFLRNKKIIADYGFLPHQKIFKGTRQSWTKDEITVKREISQTDPTLMCFSSESKGATGAHFDGIIFDDVWSRILDRNPDNKEKWLEWFDGELEGCLDDAWELWLLTRKGLTDLYQTMEDRQYYVVLKTPAIIEFPSKWHVEYKEVKGKTIFDKIIVESKDWKISDPSRFSPEFFLEKKMKMNPAEWESEFQLNPTARSGKYWKWKDIQTMNGYGDFFDMIKHPTRRAKSKIIGCIDPAFGKSARSDYTALVVLGYYEQKHYFLELFLKRGASENDTVKILAQAKKTFPTLETVYVEADFQQSARAEALKKKAGFLHILPVLARQEQALLNKDKRNVNLKGKQLRIWSQLEAIIEDHKLYVNKNMTNFKEFKTEFLTFPKCEHFDVLDALSSGVSKMQKKGALLYSLHG